MLTDRDLGAYPVWDFFLPKTLDSQLLAELSLSYDSSKRQNYLL